jgi:hypothetical protein
MPWASPRDDAGSFERTIEAKRKRADFDKPVMGTANAVKRKMYLWPRSCFWF